MFAKSDVEFYKCLADIFITNDFRYNKEDVTAYFISKNNFYERFIVRCKQYIYYTPVWCKTCFQAPSSWNIQVLF